MPAKSKEKEERKLKLPAGDPEAGYVSPDPSFVDGVETFSEEEQEARDDAADAWEEEVAAIADHEHEVATARLEEEAQTQAKEEKQTKAAAPAASSTKT